jgi:endogenous inhibitor of DNA gyrase (YacG/DUF329 family)
MSQPSSEGLRCPVCGKPREERFRPFCSRRCAQIDLGRWLKGSYAVPGRESDEGDGAPGPGQDAEEG